jgi:alpha-mannosidase
VVHHLVVVPHTHWDREWYRTREEFRYRLVGLVDALLDLLESDPGFRHFTLDGQALLVDDYLELRPGERRRIERLVREGRLLVGPWYVLPDEWLVSGEALIRNLRRGLARAESLGQAMRLGYVPDQFGHVGQLPQILAGFGLSGAAAWRGVGADVPGSLFEWEAPDGTRLLTAYLLQGYGNAARLPLEPEALAERLRAATEALAPRSRTPTLLLMNGGDHEPPQAGLPTALDAALRRLDGITAEIGTLPGYLARVRREAPDDLPLHRGELRSGLRAPLLEGCASARAPQKRADFRNDRLLTRYLEPLASWLAALGGNADPAVLDLAWDLVLQNHPHDSICGCSIDAVHREMDVRFERVAQLGEAHLRRVGAELGARVAAPAVDVAGAGAPLLVWNPHAAGATPVEGPVDLEAAGAGSPKLHLRAADGRRVPVHAVPLEPGATLADHQLPAGVVVDLLRGFPGEFMGLFPRGLRSGRRSGTRWVDVWLGSQRRPDFDFEAARGLVLGLLSGDPSAPVRYRVRRSPRVSLRFVDELPGHGLRTYRLARGACGVPAAAASGRSPGGGAWLANPSWRVEVDASGRVDWTHRSSGAVAADAVWWASEGDRGDTYNFDPVPDDRPPRRLERVRVRCGPSSEAEASLVVEGGLRVSAGLEAGRSRRSRRRVTLPVRMELRLANDSDRVEFAVQVDNRARDHRLRLHLRAPFEARAFEVESAFEVVERPIAPAPDAFGGEWPAERPIGACPKRSFATLSDGRLGFSVATRGATEVEAVPEPGGGTSLAVTLLRAVGWLSRGDLALRPGHAGPALETPGAQVPGPHRLALCFRLHPTGETERLVEAHRFAAPALLFEAGAAEGPLRDGARLLELDAPSAVVSAVEPCAGSGALLRVYNASAEPCPMTLRWCAGRGAQLEPVTLAADPCPRHELEPAPGGGLRGRLRPWQIVSLRVR